MVETATDLLLGGRLKLEQSLRGHRAGTDAILLAASVPGEFAGVLADAGAGVGTAGLAAALSRPGLDLLLIEREPELAALAVRNLAANGVRGQVVTCDLLDPKSRRAAGVDDGAAGLVISNPPFLDPGEVRASPDDLRARAHVFEGAGGLESWIRACVAIGSCDRLWCCIRRMGLLRRRPRPSIGERPASAGNLSDRRGGNQRAGPKGCGGRYAPSSSEAHGGASHNDVRAHSCDHGRAHSLHHIPIARSRSARPAAAGRQRPSKAWHRQVPQGR